MDEAAWAGEAERIALMKIEDQAIKWPKQIRLENQ
jgi:hypothetical protein